uniref:Uncharacterized protein n=1 Tax=Calidris pygmaea TaxID=425635 RepID=A0A8C3PRF2_9CHAR
MSAGVPEPRHGPARRWTTLGNICSSLLELVEFGCSRQGNLVSQQVIPATRKQDSSDLLGSEGPVPSPQEWWHLPQSVLCPMTPFCELLVPSIALAWSFSSPPPASLLNHPLHTHPFVNTAHPPCSPHP